MANLVELFDNIVQMQNLNGVPLAAGKLYVYALGRTTLMNTWSDVDGTSLNPNPIILDAAGQAHVYVSDDFDYTLVVCDQYNNEIFSLDKYLYSKGSHSHADVAVAPSESIAVSSYHVGETTVYVPYLTGQLGKVYEGIDPIVVNNTEDKISANHVPLGVQDPLYFVQDDEDACIIGFSGGSVDPNEYIPWSASGTFQTAGNYATKEDLNEYTERSAFASAIESINLNKLDVSSFSSVSSDFLQSSDLNGYATENWVTSQGYLTAVDLTPYQTTAEMTGYLKTGDSANFYTTANESGFITGVDLTPYQTTAGMTAYQPILTLETGSI